MGAFIGGYLYPHGKTGNFFVPGPEQDHSDKAHKRFYALQARNTSPGYCRDFAENQPSIFKR